MRPDDLLMMKPDEQYVVAASKEFPRDAMRLRNTQYWKHRQTGDFADPNPYVERKLKAAGLLNRRERMSAEERFERDFAKAREEVRARLGPAAWRRPAPA